MLFLHKALAGVLVVILLAALSGGATLAQTPRQTPEDYTPSVGQSGKDVIWVPTPQALVDRMLDIAGLTPADRLVDLGSGDGRMVITAAKRGAAARGIEYNPDMVAYARRQAAAEGVAGRVVFEQGDIFASDFSDATVITLFLLPDLNLQLRPILLDMAPGTRIVSNSFDMGDWEPDDSTEATENCVSYCRAMKWVVPVKVGGTWMLDGKALQLQQTYQKFEGAHAGQALRDGRLDGVHIRFTVGSDQYTGQVAGDRMQGMVNGSRPWQAVRSAG